jgi:CRISPR/Cas system CSM-associated protein Csm3 (group 7 of RAMP superfamily)
LKRFGTVQASRIDVYRDSPTPRDRYNGLSGLLVLKMKTLTYVHVGSGTEEIKIPRNIDEIVGGKSFEKAVKELKSRIAADFIKNTASSGKPVIPASTMKGRTRTRIELTLPPTRDRRQWSCFIKASLPQNAGRPAAWRHRKFYGDAVFENRGPSCDLTRSNTICLTCDMFGTAGLQGLVSFSDFIAEQNTLENITGEFGMKLQAIKPGTEMVGRVYFRNLSKSRLGLLLYGLGICGNPSGHKILVGRLKYRRELGGKPFGIAVLNLTEVMFTKVLEDLDGVVPEKPLTGEGLIRLCSTLWDAAVKMYNVQVFDEAEKLGRA